MSETISCPAKLSEGWVKNWNPGHYAELQIFRFSPPHMPRNHPTPLVPINESRPSAGHRQPSPPREPRNATQRGRHGPTHRHLPSGPEWGRDNPGNDTQRNQLIL
jgi:hypothetical protein